MALAALLAVSCSKETGRQQEETSLPQGGTISVQASVSELTKAATAGAETSFEAGDQLSLYVWTGSAAAVSSKKVVNGVVNTFDGNLWTPAETMLWKNVRDPHFFLGIFPAREVSSFTADPVTSGEDLLVATVLGDGIVAPQTTTAPPVDLVFDHMMARLNVNVKYRNQWGGVPEDAVVVAKAATQGTIDYLTKTITPGEVTTQALTATAAATGYDATYSALCIPQDGVRAFEFHIDGQTLVYTHGEALPLQAGKVTSISLLVGKDKIAVDDGTVANWDEGEVDPDMEDAFGVLANVTRPLTFKALENGTSVTFTERSSGTVTWITSDGRSGKI
ncbi:MAG: fimbrillin family protein, partial [Bacteroidales bacterium]|nr:fimbrillin family protein [Bacteroidales bacterium]